MTVCVLPSLPFLVVAYLLHLVGRHIVLHVSSSPCVSSYHPYRDAECRTMLILNIAETGVATVWFNDATVSGRHDICNSTIDVLIL